MMRTELHEVASLEAVREVHLARHRDFNLTDLRLSEMLLLHGLVGVSPAISNLRTTLKKVAAIDAPVLIVGPTGSGKELAAVAVWTENWPSTASSALLLPASAAYGKKSSLG